MGGRGKGAEHPTSNAQRPTSNSRMCHRPRLRHWMLGVRCWMFCLSSGCWMLDVLPFTSPMTSESHLKQLRAAIRDVPDFPKQGIIFKDITPVLSDGKL